MDDTQTSQPRPANSTDEIEKIPGTPIARRDLLKIAGAGAIATTMASLSTTAWMPRRVAAATAATQFPDIQFDLSSFVHPATTVNGIQVQFGVTYTYMAPCTLSRTPGRADQAILEGALQKIEATYPFSPGGVFTMVAYGVPYFSRFSSSLVASTIPRLASNTSRFALEEAVPSPTDVSSANPQISKRTFNVPVTIETNQVLFLLRSDNLNNITDVISWLQGSNSLNGQAIASPAFNSLLTFHTARINFVQPGLPRQMANQRGFSYASSINPASSMFMGFVDQQVNASAPSAATVTFAGTNTARLTTARAGDYFDNGSVIHVAHTIMDLAQFYENSSASQEDFSERIQYMFHSFKSDGTSGLLFPQDPNDGFTNGGGQGAPTGSLTTQQQSAFLPNIFFGTNKQASNFDPASLPTRVLRVGHTVGLQRSSRSSNGTPLHIRIDGPGISRLDVPDGSAQPTLEFAVFVPTAEFFRVMRVNSASLDFVSKTDGGTATSVPTGVTPSAGEDDGLERFLTATRRQNWLIPPRRHRSFPLAEF